MTKLGDAEIISGAALGALGVFIVLQASRWEYYGASGPGPAFFPTFYGAALVLLSLLHIVSRLRAEPAAAQTVAGNAPEKAEGLPGWVKALSCWAVFTGIMVLMDWLGFFLGFALLNLYVVLVIFRKSILTALATAIGMSAGFYLLFSVLLEINLPTGIVGF
jgi:putative tricarboxylic transport membrane protein